MNHKFLMDYGRSGREWNPIIGRLRLIKKHDLAFLYWARKEEISKNKFLEKYYAFRRYVIGNRHGLEMML